MNLVAGRDYDLKECHACGARFFDPMPCAEELAAFYSAPYFDTFNRSRMEGRGRAFARRIDRIRGPLPPGRFLDVGCAAGFFINGLRAVSGWEVYGVEFSESAIRYASSNLGIPADRFRRSTSEFPATFFDFIHINNVLEHVTDPVATLTDCRRVLRDDGLAYVSIPNGLNDSQSLIRYHKEEGAAPRSKDGHLVFLSPNALSTLFQRSGFAVVSCRTYGFNRGLRNLGLLPQKSNWKDHYRPRPAVPANGQSVEPVEGRRHSDLYHRYRLFRSTLGAPGLRRFGLDFLFVLKPSKRV
ncbi:MAG TPA: class I SAM-dependent methyltransferase [Terriglobia bacterium]|nr:class I SAM-dependent methyltransferase [Terriglobia bacterium]